MPFNPRPEYTISEQLFSIKEFHEYADDFVTRPPYQKKFGGEEIKIYCE